MKSHDWVFRTTWEVGGQFNTFNIDEEGEIRTAWGIVELLMRGEPKVYSIFGWKKGCNGKARRMVRLVRSE